MSSCTRSAPELTSAQTFGPAVWEALGEGQRYRPTVSFRRPPSSYDYVESEWLLSGDAAGEPFTTTAIVRVPSDTSRFSGVVLVEPVHFSGIAPVSLYCSDYVMRSGHGWVFVASQKTTIDHHVRPANSDRYRRLRMAGPEPRPFPGRASHGDREALRRFWTEMAEMNVASSEVLAATGRSIVDRRGPFAGLDVGPVLLVGHSQTGSVVTRFLRECHSTHRRGDGGPVFDGYFPSGFPVEAFGPCEVPIVQVISDGDVSDPAGTFTPVAGRRYRRPDSDHPSDRFRLYELAAMPHMGTRHPPFDTVELWRSQGTDIIDGAVMNSLPHGELFSACLHHLVEWVRSGTVPPRADRIVVGDDGRFSVDDVGNSLGGVRCVQIDVPRATYHPNVLRPDGSPTTSTVGTEVPLSEAELRTRYRDADGYATAFRRRVDELVAGGWLLVDDVPDMEADVEQVRVLLG